MMSFIMIVLISMAACTLGEHSKTENRPFTLEELKKFDGSDADLPIYIGFLGRVFDVSEGKGYYGKGGAYNTFAGRDATRSFVTGCFDRDETACPNPSDISALSEQEIKSMDDYLKLYTESDKYFAVGYIVDDDGNNISEIYDTQEKRLTFAKEAKKDL